MDVRGIKHAAKLSEWSERIRACRSSGKPVRTWCEENAYVPVKSKTMIEFLVANQEKFDLEYTHHLRNSAGRQVRGFRGIGAMFHPSPGWTRSDSSGER